MNKTWLILAFIEIKRSHRINIAWPQCQKYTCAPSLLYDRWKTCNLLSIKQSHLPKLRSKLNDSTENITIDLLHTIYSTDFPYWMILIDNHRIINLMRKAFVKDISLPTPSLYSFYHLHNPLFPSNPYQQFVYVTIINGASWLWLIFFFFVCVGIFLCAIFYLFLFRKYFKNTLQFQK